MSFLKNVVSASASNFIGEDFKNQFADAKKQIKEQADAAGITDGINRAKKSIDAGKSKFQELSTDNKGKNLVEETMDRLPDNVMLVDITPQSKNMEQPKESEFDSLNNQMEQIKKLKDLVDLGILSQEEFEIKKKEVLGI